VAEITTALLAYARQSSHEQSLLDLNAVVRSALLLWQPQAERGVRVKTVLDEPLPPIMGNFTQLQQVVINLLSNALDAIPAGVRLRCPRGSLGEFSSTVVLEVTDTGPASRRSISPRSSIHFYHQTPGERHGAWALGVLGNRAGSSWHDHCR